MEYITVIASPAAVVALVNFLKQFGVDGKWSFLAAVLLGVAVNLANYYFGDIPAYQAGITGLIMGLAAAGLYDLREGSGA